MTAWDHKQSVKEVIKHYGFKLGADRLISRDRQRRGLKVEHLDKSTPAERFREIYKLGVWVHSEDQESASGTGSEMVATDSVREGLPDLLTRLDCKVLLDVGCGDWAWLRDVALPCDYLGVDIVRRTAPIHNGQFYGAETPSAPVTAILLRRVLRSNV